MKQIINKFIPYITLGVAIAVIIFGMMIFAYLFLFGALIGIFLYIYAFIKQKYFSPKKPPATITPIKKGQTIDSDDWRVL